MSEGKHQGWSRLGRAGALVLWLAASCVRYGYQDRPAGGDLSRDAPRDDGGVGADADGGGDAWVPGVGGSLPVITSFSVVNAASGATEHAAGGPVKISWTVTDAEGLASGPVDLSYTTDNVTWTPIVKGYGGLAGNPTSYSGDYSGFKAPGGSYFRLRLVAFDRAGQSSIPALSDSQNTPRWSVYAGSPDPGLGGGALGVALSAGDNGPHKLAVDPTTRDIYAVHEDTGVFKLDAKTGRVSLFMRRASATNLPDSGALPADPTYDSAAGLLFGTDGRLYLTLGPWDFTSSRRVYQVDPATSRVRAYLGGGMVNDGSATSDTVFVVGRTMAMDEGHALYFMTSCSPGSWTSSGTVRVLRASQNPDGTAGAISVFAGNCVRGSPPRPGPGDAASSPLTDSNYPGIGSIAVWNNGKSCYYAFYGSGVQKILDGKSYSSDIQVESAASIHYNRVTGKLYAANRAVTEHTPNLAGADGDAGQVLISGDGTGSACHADGVAAAAACADAHFTMDSASDGTLYYMDGVSLNVERTYRVRYRDAAGKVQTRLGTLPFHGDGLHRRLLRGRPAGIHYKGASAPSQGAFPEGLYFLDSGGLVLGHIAPQTGLVTVRWGNQRQDDVIHPTGTPISPDLTMGRSYFGGDAMPLTLDAQGLPWLRYNDVLARVDATGKIVALQPSAGKVWENAPDGADPADYDFFPYGLRQNLTLKGGGAFLIGGYKPHTDTVSIRYFDFTSHAVTRIMGSLPNGASPDSATPGSVKSLSLSSSCQYADNCFAHYRADQDRLYFGEEHKIRYITSPTDTSASTLGTLLTASGAIDNFSFRPDGKQVFYVLQSSGKLRCHDLGSGASWCDDTDLGPPSGLSTLGYGPNALTWKSASELLVSTYRGEIYLHALPP